MAKSINFWFDMDGTIADLYGVENWLQMLIAEDATPYKIARPLVNMSRLARRIHKAQSKGATVNIISWTSKNGSVEYNSKVATAKKNWLKKHLPSVKWNSIIIVPYGTPKSLCGKGVLFDDEERNRTEWGEGARLPSEIFEYI